MPEYDAKTPDAHSAVGTRLILPSITRRKLLGSSVLAALTATVAGCGATHRDGGSAGPSAPPGVTRVTTPVGRRHHVVVTDYGATGDGHTDDTAALVKAFAALAPNGLLVVPAGIYIHSTVLEVTATGSTLMGPGTLSASAEATSSVQIIADGVTVDGLVLAAPHTTRRWSAPDQHKLYLGPYSGCVVRNLTVEGSAAAGIFCFGASNFIIDNAHVVGTRADGIHMTFGSHHGTVRSPLIERTGDDGVAVVSYVEDGRQCHDIEIISPSVHTTTGGRGISVVGGTSVHYTDIDVRDSAAAGVYVACEGGGAPTNSVDGVTVSGGTVAGANTDAAIDQGAVLIYAGRSEGTVTDTTIEHLDVSETRPNASRQVGVVVDNGGAVSRVAFSELLLADSPTPYQGNAASGFRLSGVTADGALVTPTSS